MIIPIRTETEVHRTPLANYALVAVNVLLYALLDLSGSADLLAFKHRALVLHALMPGLHEFLTYQFLHWDAAHLLGNMLFLWVFGNAVNAKLGHTAYVLFYLAGGVFAALGFALTSSDDLLGASGSIAGVTAAYLVLFPRSHVTVLYFVYFVGSFDVPAIIMIGLKIILWDNVVAPHVSGAGNVAVTAHLAGYAFGLAAVLLMLLIRVVPRDKFDLLALVKRWGQRRAFATMMSDPNARARAELGPVARPIAAPPQQQAANDAHVDRISGLRLRIDDCLGRGDVGAAATLYEQLVTLDPRQCLSARHQIELAREFYSTGRSPQAAAAFERYLASYETEPDADEIRLLLGIVYARDLHQYESAERHLAIASQRLTDETRQAQCGRWLSEVRSAVKGTTRDSAP